MAVVACMALLPLVYSCKDGNDEPDYNPIAERLKDTTWHYYKSVDHLAHRDREERRNYYWTFLSTPASKSEYKMMVKELDSSGLTWCVSSDASSLWINHPVGVTPELAKAICCSRHEIISLTQDELVLGDSTHEIYLKRVPFDESMDDGTGDSEDESDSPKFNIIDPNEEEEVTVFEKNIYGYWINNDLNSIWSMGFQDVGMGNSIKAFKLNKSNKKYYDSISEGTWFYDTMNHLFGIKLGTSSYIYYKVSRLTKNTLTLTGSSEKMVFTRITEGQLPTNNPDSYESDDKDGDNDKNNDPPYANYMYCSGKYYPITKIQSSVHHSTDSGDNNSKQFCFFGENGLLTPVGFYIIYNRPSWDGIDDWSTGTYTVIAGGSPDSNKYYQYVGCGYAPNMGGAFGAEGKFKISHSDKFTTYDFEGETYFPSSTFKIHVVS